MIHWSQHLGQAFTDINKALQELRQYIEDLAALDVLALEPTGSKSNQSNTTTQFYPSKLSAAIEYAVGLLLHTEFMPTVRLTNRSGIRTRPPASRMCRNTFSDDSGISGGRLNSQSFSGIPQQSCFVLMRPDTRAADSLESS